MSDNLNPANPILIVDDEYGILLAMDTTLKMAGLNNTITCQDSRNVADILSEHEVGVVLLDLNMPHIQGEKILTIINHEFPEIPVIVVTGAIDVETAVRCMKEGAFDYVLKPVEEGRLITALGRALSFSELKRENRALKQHILTDKLESPETFKEIITQNKKMTSLFLYIESIAHTSQAVLITGETGVGKELFAKTIHDLSGLKGNFVAVNMAGLDDTVFSDTLFGHTKGAFTGADRMRQGLIEKAAGGTLFLDEIGDLSMSSQVKLLRLLQEGEFLPLGQDEASKTDARIIAATNDDLFALEREGKFRKDLIFRLRTHHIHIPPLRERLDDLDLLVDNLLSDSAKELNKKVPTPPRELITLLRTFSFPGNIRELQSMVFDAVSRHKSRILSLDAFKNHIAREQENKLITAMPNPETHSNIAFAGDLPTIKQATHSLVAEAIKQARGNQSIAAKILGISQQALSKRLKNKGLQDSIQKADKDPGISSG
jgi:DNA-binding NtrC family response regulator